VDELEPYGGAVQAFEAQTSAKHDSRVREGGAPVTATPRLPEITYLDFCFLTVSLSLKEVLEFRHRLRVILER
jgi:hypothetical protein